MAENFRKRTSKWDVMEESRVQSDNIQDDSLAMRAADSFGDQEIKSHWNSSKHEATQLSNSSDMEVEGTAGGKDSSKAERSSQSDLDDGHSKIPRIYSGRSPSPMQHMKANSVHTSKKPFLEPVPGSQTRGRDYCDGNRARNGFDTSLDPHNRSMSPGYDKWRQRSPSVSPRSRQSRSRRSRSRSRSRGRGRGRSRSRSRSRSPHYGTKRGSERWVGRVRKGTSGSAEPCRNFAAGWCRRGSECSYLHEDRRGQYERHHDRGSAEIGSRFDRNRYSGYDSKENVADSRGKRDQSWDKSSRSLGNNYDGQWDKPEQHGNGRSTECCYDFTKGKCQRGSTCRYVHADASSDTAWPMKDESGDRKHDDRNLVSRQRLESRKVSETLCKFFSEGYCRRGEGCKFSHQDLSRGHVVGARDGSLSYEIGNDNSSSWNHQNGGDQTVSNDTKGSSQWVGNGNSAEVAAANSLDADVSRKESQQLQVQNDDKYVIVPKEVIPSDLPAQEQRIGKEASGHDQHASMVSAEPIADSAYFQEQPGIKSEMLSFQSEGTVAKIARFRDEMNSSNSLHTSASLSGLSISQNGRNVPSQPLQAQSLVPNVQVQQLVPLVPSNGELQQVAYTVLLHGQNPVTGLLEPSDNRTNNLSVNSQEVISSQHEVQSERNNLSGVQVQQNVRQLHSHPQSQHRSNFRGHLPQGLPAAHIVQNMPSLSPLLPTAYNQQSLDSSGRSQQSLPHPQNGQGQQSLHSLVPCSQNLYVGPQPLPVLQNSTSSNPSHQLIQKGFAISPDRVKADGEKCIQKADASKIRSPQSTSGSIVTQKAVTSEQIAQISNLSATLAQFFGNGPNLPQLYATLKPHSATVSAAAPVQPGQVPYPQQHHDLVPACSNAINFETSNLPPGFSMSSVGQKELKTDEPQEFLKSVALSSLPRSEGNPIQNLEEHQGNPESEQIQPCGATESKELNETEAGLQKKEMTAQSEDVAAEVGMDSGKRKKDAKGIRAFKCALVDFVKDLLKPAWKEGNVSKEAHKTIVKKVADKVTTALQGSFPQTPEKIDAYLSNSKPKLNKLVQAYVEKYAKN